MSFKHFVVTGIFLVTAVVGCAKSGAPANTPILIQLKGDGNCLSTFGTEIKSFTNGQMSAAQVNGFWTCISNSIQDFQRLTVGDLAGGAYSPAALRQFIEHYFATSKPLTDGMLVGIMEIKRVFLGGTNQAVTPAEMSQLLALIDQFKAVTLTLQPSAGVLFRDVKGASEDQVRQAAGNLQSATSQLAAWLTTQNQSLNISSLVNLVNAIVAYQQSTGTVTSTVTSLQTAVAMLPDIKSILIGGDPNVISGQEWGALFNAISRGISAYIAVANGADQNIDAALQRVTVAETVAPVLDVISTSANRHAGGQITMSEFSSLFTKVAASGWLPAAMNAGALNSAWQWALTRLLGDGSTRATGLSAIQVATLHQVFDNWQSLYNLPSTDPGALVQAFNAIVNASPPANWDAQGRMLFPVTMSTTWTLAGRDHLIWEYVVLTFVKNAYAGPAVTFLTADQINTAAGEILPILQNFGWLLTTQPTIGNRLLREADLFTLASNGDGNLDMHEAVRYVAFIMSSYRMAQVWLASADASCGNHGINCVHNLGTQPGSGVLGNMPRLQAVIAKWPAGQFTSYMQHAETTILGNPESGTFATGDLLQSLQLFAYVEVFIERYDTNPVDEMIELGEAQTAYQLYGPTLERMLGLTDSDNEAFFTFMMKYGDTPFTMFGGQVAFNYWRWNPTTWQFSADRDILMSILSQLSKL